MWCALQGGNLYGSGMSFAMTVSPRPTFRAPCRVDDIVVGRGNAGWTTSKSGHPCLCQNCSCKPSAEKDWKRISAELFHMSPRRPDRSRDWTELICHNDWHLNEDARILYQSKAFSLNVILVFPFTKLLWKDNDRKLIKTHKRWKRMCFLISDWYILCQFLTDLCY